MANIPVSADIDAFMQSANKQAALVALGFPVTSDILVGDRAGGSVASGGISITPSANNPTLINGSEIDMVMVGSTCHQWYRLVNGSTLFHRTADNALLDNWTSPDTCTGISGALPTVRKHGSTYYCTIKKPDINTGDIYLYSSTDGLAWTAMNSGSPIITHSATATDWRANVYNAGFDFDASGNIYMMVEAKASSGGYSGWQHLGYTHGSLTALGDLQTNLGATPTFLNANDPYIGWSPIKNALTMLYCYAPSGYSFLRAATVPLSADPAQLSNWLQGTATFENLNDSGAGNSGPSIVFTPGKTHAALVVWNYNQATGYQGYAEVASADDLYDSITNLKTPQHALHCSTLSAGAMPVPGVALNVFSPNQVDAFVQLFCPHTYYATMRFGFSVTNSAYFEWQSGGLIIGTQLADSHPITIRGSHFNVNSAATFNSGLTFASSDPGIAGAWWDNAGTLTRSAG